MSVVVFTSRDEKWVGEGREDDTTEKNHYNMEFNKSSYHNSMKLKIFFIA